MRFALIAIVLAACANPAASPTPPPTPASLGGSTATPSPTSSVSLAWRRIANIPTPRSEVAAAVFRGIVYVVGGIGGGDVVEAYAGRNDLWSSAPRYPLKVDHPMAAGVDAEGSPPGVYVLGGNVNGVATARSFRLAEQGWREIAAMPAPRSQAAAVAIGGRIYVVGGAAAGRLVGPTYVYDTATDRWSESAAIPTPRDHLAAAALGGRVCAVGGRRLSMAQNLKTFECYDPAADRWTAMPDAPTARGGVGAAAIDQRLFFVGGEQPQGTFREVEIFDGATGTWSRGPDLPTARHGLGVVSVGVTLYVMSGGPTPGGSQTPVCEAVDVR
ncbi:MAG TPA: kelch repeat-containing protein [Candidatus Limnocylindria bacterium]|jgi:non-specific serine/threonine protein kinase|nr:kelch repeat-containing protein [Candidatus Limnocylindria bacterium]